MSGQQKLRNNGNKGTFEYGEYCCTQGDVIGCSVDFQAKTVQFWKNGKSMGVAFSDVVPPQQPASASATAATKLKNSSSGDSNSNSNLFELCAFVGLCRRGRCRVNFGGNGEKFLVEATAPSVLLSYSPLHSNLDQQKLKQLIALFKRYRGTLEEEEEAEATLHAHSRSFSQFKFSVAVCRYW